MMSGICNHVIYTVDNRLPSICVSRCWLCIIDVPEEICSSFPSFVVDRRKVCDVFVHQARKRSPRKKRNIKYLMFLIKENKGV